MNASVVIVNYVEISYCVTAYLLLVVKEYLNKNIYIIVLK